MEYYSALQKNETLPFATMWMDLECIILSEICHTEKDKYSMLSLIYGMYQINYRNVHNNREIDSQM